MHDKLLSFQTWRMLFLHIWEFLGQVNLSSDLTEPAHASYLNGKEAIIEIHKIFQKFKFISFYNSYNNFSVLILMELRTNLERFWG